MISLGPNKPFQTLKHHNLLSVLGSGYASQFKDPNSASWELVQSYTFIITEYLRSDDIFRPAAGPSPRN